DGSGATIASPTYTPATWAGVETLVPGTVSYTGNGNGNVTLRLADNLVDNRFGGAIDNLGIYQLACATGVADCNGSLSDFCELGRMTAAKSGAGCGTRCSSSGGNLCMEGTGSEVGAWAFNEGRGSPTADATGNGHTGALTNTTWTTGHVGTALTFQGSSS